MKKKQNKDNKSKKAKIKKIIDQCMIGYCVNGTIKGCITHSEIEKLIKALEDNKII